MCECVCAFMLKSILRSNPSHKISSMKLCVVLINIYWSRKKDEFDIRPEAKCNLVMHFNLTEFTINSKFDAVLLFHFCKSERFFSTKENSCAQSQIEYKTHFLCNTFILYSSTDWCCIQEVFVFVKEISLTKLNLDWPYTENQFKVFIYIFLIDEKKESKNVFSIHCFSCEHNECIGILYMLTSFQLFWRYVSIFSVAYS